MIRLNAPETLFKYYDAETAIEHVLGKNTLKWSNPSEFNDPFDNQYELHMEPVTNELVEELVAFWKSGPDLSFIQFSNGSYTIPGEVLSEGMKYLNNEELAAPVREFIEQLDSDFPKFKSEFMTEMEKTGILCLTESHTNLLMWSHYANKHTGVVLAFSEKDPQSPLPSARKVQYSLETPKLLYKDFFMFMGDPNAKIALHVGQYTLAKSNEWAYEQEWRIVVPGNIGIRPFSAEEVDAIYLGCRTSKENKEKILEIARNKYPWAAIFEASKNPTRFALDFTRLA